MTLTEVKEHLRVKHDLEDAVIQTYLDAAIQHVQAFLGTDLPDPMPKPVEAAVLLLTGDLYMNREKQTDRMLFQNSAYTLLLDPYRTREVL